MKGFVLMLSLLMLSANAMAAGKIITVSNLNLVNSGRLPVKK